MDIFFDHEWRNIRLIEFAQQHPIETSLINFSTSAKQNKNNSVHGHIQQNILLSARGLKFSMQYTQLYIINRTHERL